MEIDKKLQEAVNKQINRELWSAYLYLSMATYFDYKSLGGFASWMKEQAKEETSHAGKLYDYLVKCGARVKMQELETPPSTWDSPLDVFQKTLEHEKKVTSLINSLMETARELEDENAIEMLEWFVEEQKEEEESAQAVVDKVKEAGDDLTQLDREMVKR